MLNYHPPVHDRGRYRPALQLVSLFFVAGLLAVSNAANSSTDGQLLPINSDHCTIEPPEDSDWTPTEVWAWDRLCRGLTADLSDLDPAPSESKLKKTDCDPTVVDEWPERRKPGYDFISTITFDSPYKEIVARQGLSLRCAHVEYKSTAGQGIEII